MMRVRLGRYLVQPSRADTDIEIINLYEINLHLVESNKVINTNLITRSVKKIMKSSDWIR